MSMKVPLVLKCAINVLAWLMTPSKNIEFCSAEMPRIAATGLDAKFYGASCIYQSEKGP